MGKGVLPGTVTAKEVREKHDKVDSLPAGCRGCIAVCWWGGIFRLRNEAIGHLTELLEGFPC